MLSKVQVVVLGLLAGFGSANEDFPRVVCTPGDGDIYGYNATLMDRSETISFEQYRGMVLLIYNVAVYSDYTVTSMTQANELADTYADQGFEVLGFPTTEFNLATPSSGYNEFMSGLTYVRPGNGFVPQMTFFLKTETNGEDENSIYTFLKGECSYVSDTFRDADELHYSPQRIGDVLGNFEKFLVGKDGKVYYRYSTSTTNSADLIPDIDQLLSA